MSEKNMSPSPSRSKQPNSFLASASGPRIFVFVILLCALVFFTKLILPDASSSTFFAGSHKHVVLQTELIPKDYLNTSTAHPAPFAFCPMYGPGDALAAQYGAHNLAKGKTFLGSGARVQKVIHRALSGLPVTISVLGGSISACHGAGDDPISQKCYPARFFDWWNSVFPHPASELTNGAMRRTDSSYFSFCSAHHLPDQTDLVILEFSSDDPADPAWVDHFDRLVRSLLQRPDQPAVVILGHFSPQVQDAFGYNDPSTIHSVIAQFYDVPMVSTKGVIFQEYSQNPQGLKKLYWVDPVLSNPKGHELLADVLISYFQEMTCKGWDAAMGRSFEVPVLGMEAMAVPGAGGLFGGAGVRKGGPEGAAAAAGAGGAGLGKLTKENPDAWAALRIPPVRANDRHISSTQNKKFREPTPFCVSANDLINPLPPSLFYGSGWHAHNPSNPKNAGAQDYYWYSTLPTSKLRVPVKLTAGDVAVYYLMEPRGDYQDGGPGVLCWVDDNVAGGVEIPGAGDVGSPSPRMVVIDRGVDAGSHFVECQLMGEEGEGSPAFKILGIFAT